MGADEDLLLLGQRQKDAGRLDVLAAPETGQLDALDFARDGVVEQHRKIPAVVVDVLPNPLLALGQVAVVLFFITAAELGNLPCNTK